MLKAKEKNANVARIFQRTVPVPDRSSSNKYRVNEERLIRVQEVRKLYPPWGRMLFSSQLKTQLWEVVIVNRKARLNKNLFCPQKSFPCCKLCSFVLSVQLQQDETMSSSLMPGNRGQTIIKLFLKKKKKSYHF